MNSSDFSRAFKDTVPNNKEPERNVKPSDTARSEQKTNIDVWKADVLRNPIQQEAPTDVLFGDYMRTSKLLIEVSKLLYGTERLLEGQKNSLAAQKTKLEEKQRGLEVILRRKNIPLPSPTQIMNYDPNNPE